MRADGLSRCPGRTLRILQARLNSRPRKLRSLLAQPGADANRAVDAAGHSLLHWAAARGHAEVVRFLLHEARPPAKLEANTLIGATSLHLAAAWNQAAAVRALLIAGARVDSLTLYGQSPAGIACTHAGDEREKARMRELVGGGAVRAKADEREAHLQAELAQTRAALARIGGAAARIQAQYHGKLARREISLHGTY